MEHEFWDVKHCVSCGQNHDAMEFHSFRGYVPFYDGAAFTHWGMCPTNNEPVLGFHLTPDNPVTDGGVSGVSVAADLVK